jgi:hypothetical protein
MDNREAFEKWCMDNVDVNLMRYKSPDDYCSDEVQLAWEAWQACTAHHEAVISELKEDILDLRQQVNYRCADVQRLEAERNTLLAVIAQKDEALEAAQISVGRLTSDESAIQEDFDNEDLIQNALALTHNIQKVG